MPGGASVGRAIYLCASVEKSVRVSLAKKYSGSMWRAWWGSYLLPGVPSIRRGINRKWPSCGPGEKYSEPGGVCWTHGKSARRTTHLRRRREASLQSCPRNSCVRGFVNAGVLWIVPSTSCRIGGRGVVRVKNNIVYGCLNIEWRGPSLSSIGGPIECERGKISADQQ